MHNCESLISKEVDKMFTNQTLKLCAIIGSTKGDIGVVCAWWNWRKVWVFPWISCLHSLPSSCLQASFAPFRIISSIILFATLPTASSPNCTWNGCSALYAKTARRHVFLRSTYSQSLQGWHLAFLNVTYMRTSAKTRSCKFCMWYCSFCIVSWHHSLPQSTTTLIVDGDAPSTSLLQDKYI